MDAPDIMLDPMDPRWGDVPFQIPSAFGVADADALYRRAAELAPHLDGRLVVEIGSWLGRSTIVLAKALPGIQVHAIDIWNPYVDWNGQRVAADVNMFRNHMALAGVGHQVVPHVGKSEDIGLAWNYGEIGLLFIDGDHTAEGVLTDWKTWAPKLAKGATVIWHDYDLWRIGVEGSGVKRVVDRLLAFGMISIIEHVEGGPGSEWPSDFGLLVTKFRHNDLERGKAHLRETRAKMGELPEEEADVE